VAKKINEQGEKKDAKDKSTDKRLRAKIKYLVYNSIADGRFNLLAFS
jgi:hypothetical protein